MECDHIERIPQAVEQSGRRVDAKDGVRMPVGCTM